MILAAAICPQPPALVPQLGPGSGELDALRVACDQAVTTLLAHHPDRVIVMGSPQRLAAPATFDESAGGSLGRFGVDVRAGGSSDVLDLSLTLGAWLLDRAGWHGPRTYTTGRPTTDDRVVILVMADGSATRTPAAPGAFDERAAAFDDEIGTALVTGDAQALERIDPAVAESLWAVGVPALREFGGVMRDVPVRPRLLHHCSPWGVAYWVAVWEASTDERSDLGHSSSRIDTVDDDQAARQGG